MLGEKKLNRPAGVWNKNPVSKKSSIPPLQKKRLNGWMKVVWYETNSQSEIRTNDG